MYVADLFLNLRICLSDNLEYPGRGHRSHRRLHAQAPGPDLTAFKKEKKFLAKTK